MLARSAGIRRNQNGRLSLSAHTTLSGFPIVVALLTQPPPNAERERKGRKGFIHSVKDAQKKKPFRTHELLSALSLPLRFGPPRSHCMKCLSVIVTRGAEIPAIFFYSLTPRRITILVPALPRWTRTRVKDRLVADGQSTDSTDRAN